MDSADGGVMELEVMQAFCSNRLTPKQAYPRQLALGLIGPGKVGKALLSQLTATRQHLLKSLNLDIRIRGIASSRTMRFDDSDAWPKWMRGEPGDQVDLIRFARNIRASDQPSVMIDCTASNDVAENYATWMRDGMHVITPNKLMGSGPWNRWQALPRASLGIQFRHEATVCAGLPVVQTLKDLVNTGDELLSIDSMFSGTLAWLFHHYDGTQAFSALLRSARNMGYTEPDTREDLSGADVARKLVILAREAGMLISMDEVQVENLVPERLRALTTDEFMSRGQELDQDMAAKLQLAQDQGGVLRHVGHLDAQGVVTVSVCVVPRTHAFAQTHATDNMVQIATRRYSDNPMQIRGPGAGPEVTAGGVFADLLRVAESL